MWQKKIEDGNNTGSCFGFRVPVCGFRVPVFCNASPFFVMCHFFSRSVPTPPTPNTLCNAPAYYTKKWRITNNWYPKPANWYPKPKTRTSVINSLKKISWNKPPMFAVSFRLQFLQWIFVIQQCLWNLVITSFECIVAHQIKKNPQQFPRWEILLISITSILFRGICTRLPVYHEMLQREKVNSEHKAGYDKEEKTWFWTLDGSFWCVLGVWNNIHVYLKRIPLFADKWCTKGLSFVTCW